MATDRQRRQAGWDWMSWKASSGDQALRDAAVRPDDRSMTATETEPEPHPSGKAASEAQAGSHAVQTEEDEALSFADAALGRVTSRLGDAASDLNEIVRVLESAGDDPQQLRDAQQALAQIQPIEDFLRRIRKRGRRQDPGDAFSVVAQVSALVSDVEAAHDRLPASDSPPGPPPPDRPLLRRLWDGALAKIREALPHLWAFISRLFTPTQWTAAGNVSTGIFGFAGASISVTFGKSD